MLEEHSAFLLEERRGVRLRQAFIEYVLDFESHARPRLGLLTPIERQRRLHLFQKLAGIRYGQL